MKKTVLFVGVVLALSLVASTALAGVSFGTRDISIKDVVVENCDGIVCDVHVWGKVRVTNSGTKDLIVTCPLTVHRFNKGPVAWGSVKLLIYPGVSQTVTWEATGTGTIDQTWKAKEDPAKYWVRRGTQGTPRAQIVSCIESV